MCDLKIYDSAKHKKWTGAGNEIIKENIARLAMSGVALTVRTPVIPGVNDDENEIGKICEFLSSVHGNIVYELLPFHTLGFEKYGNLGMRNQMNGTRDLDIAVLERLKRIPEQYGF